MVKANGEGLDAPNLALDNSKVVPKERGIVTEVQAKSMERVDENVGNQTTSFGPWMLVSKNQRRGSKGVSKTRMERKEAGSQSFEAVVNKGKEVDSSPSPAAKNWKEDDYCHSINLIRQAQFMIGGDKLGLEGLPYVQTYLPSKEDIRTANKINRNMGDVGTTSNPPTPEQWLMHTLLWFLSRFLPWWSKLSFNRGVGSKGFPRLVKDLCGPYHSNILCLLETRISGTKATNIARKFGFSSWHLVEGVGFSGDTGGVSNLSRDHHRFAVCLLDSELHDIGFQGEPFTWQRETIRRRLDRYVANNSWSLQFSQALVKHLPKLKYDYVPILLNLDYHDFAHSEVTEDMLDEQICDYAIDGRWDYERISLTLGDNWLPVIVAIKPPEPSFGEDSLAWLPTSNGQFLMKPAGALFFSNAEEDRSSLFHRIWKLKAPQWLCTFCWLVANEALLTNERRCKRHMTSDDRCGVYHNFPESLLHVLRDCEVARRTWMSIDNSLVTGRVWPLLFATTMDLLWYRRNKVIFYAAEFLEEGKLASLAIHLANNVQHVYTTVGNMKKKVGTFIDKQDNNGNFIARFSANLAYGTIIAAELWGVFLGVDLALSLGLESLHIEVDSLAAAKLCFQEGIECHSLKAIVLAIKDRYGKLCN
ncbi:hypothetical protein Ahy_B06g084517 [Arachis hypogaea]|uniref:RNase H type-1 domain-containing protein n=1 Tax=Arachis hypogaea TaxID=3818 RepID=A0A444YS33_ARAHY|nr:hypothetical protein Ahy_B06g084517 [Arachis hypogaea]